MYLEIEFWAITIKDTEYAWQISKSTLLKEITALTHTKQEYQHKTGLSAGDMSEMMEEGDTSKP